MEARTTYINCALTKKQAEVLEFIKDFSRNNKGSTPTSAEIADHFGFKSPNGAYDHVKRITKKGYLTMTPDISRGIRIVGSNKLDIYSYEELIAELERRGEKIPALNNQ